MKKSASKAPKTSAKAKPAPAQAKAPAAKKSAATPAPKVKKTTAAPEVAATALNVAPAVKAPAPEALAVTTIVAQVDIGFGNTLFIRGEGAGLSWDAGLPLDNQGPDRWQIELKGAKAPVTFKFLVNDQTWCLGEDYVVAAGSSIALVPLF